MPWASSLSWLLDRSAREWWRHPPIKEPRDEHQDHCHRRLSRPFRCHQHQAGPAAATDVHIGNDPEAIHWGHVGDLGRVDHALDECPQTVCSWRWPSHRPNASTFSWTPNRPTNARQNCLSLFSRNPLTHVGVIFWTSDFARPEGTEKREREQAEIGRKQAQRRKAKSGRKVKNPARLGDQRGCSEAKKDSLPRVNGGGCGPGFNSVQV